MGKRYDNLVKDLEAATLMVMGTARSMGIDVTK